MRNLTDRQREIADMALDIIADHGIQRLTTKSLARALHVTEPALYRHYKSRFDILMAILAAYRENLQKLFDRAKEDDGPSPEIIERFYDGLFDSFVVQPALSAVLFSEDIFRYDRRLSNEVESIIELIHDWILGLIKEGARYGRIRNDIPTKQMAWMVMGTMRILVTKWRISRYTLNLTKEGKTAMKCLRLVITQ